MNIRSKKIQNCEAPCHGTLRVHLHDSGENKLPIRGADIEVLEWSLGEWQSIETRTTDENGYATFKLLGGDAHRYGLAFKNAFGFNGEPVGCSDDELQEELISIDCDCTKRISLGAPVNFTQQLAMCGPRSEEQLCQDIVAGQPAKLRISHSAALGNPEIKLSSNQGILSQPSILRMEWIEFMR